MRQRSLVRGKDSVADSLLTGVNHVALAAADLDATVRFYSEGFGLEATDLSPPGEDRNVFLFFPNGSFLHVCESTGGVRPGSPVRPVPGNLIYDGAPLDHFSLFASDTDALQEI